MDAKTTAVHYHHARTGADDSAGVTQPDVMAPAQYENFRRTKILQPEKSLMLAILEDAVRCFQENYSARCGNSKRIYLDAQRWLFGNYGDWVFGFENICANLGLDPQYIRRGLRAWKAKQLSKERAATLLRANNLATIAGPAVTVAGIPGQQDNAQEGNALR